MPGLVTSHPLSLLVIVTCLIVLAAPARRRINCTRYVFHPVCRGIAAKRSSSSSFSLPSSSSSSFSSSLSSSPSSSSRRFGEPRKNIYETNVEDRRPNLQQRLDRFNLLRKLQQQVQRLTETPQQLQHRRQVWNTGYAPNPTHTNRMDKDFNLMSKQFQEALEDRLDLQGYYPTFDNEDST